MALKVVRTESTPNPNATKYVLSERRFDPPVSCFNAQAADSHPLAAALFAIDGVASVLLLGDFVTVNRRPDGPAWKVLTPKVKKVLAGWE